MIRRAAALAFVCACFAAPAARADRLCVVEAPRPAEVYEFEHGAVIGALPPGMPVVVTDRTFLDDKGRPWVFAQSFDQVSGWIADDFVRCQ